MGYCTSVTGEILIVPALTWGEVQNSPFLRGTDGWPVGNKEVALRISEETIETADGTLIRREATAVEPASEEDSYRCYGIDAHLQELVDAFGGDHAFDGYLEGHGEDFDDIWRLYVDERGAAVKVKARITWPD